MSIKNPEGWLLEPNGKWIIHFEKSIGNASDAEPKVNIDTWGVNSNGKPSVFKSRRKITFNESKETWNQLRSSGWKQVEYKNSNVA